MACSEKRWHGLSDWLGSPDRVAPSSQESFSSSPGSSAAVSSRPGSVVGADAGTDEAGTDPLGLGLALDEGVAGSTAGDAALLGASLLAVGGVLAERLCGLSEQAARPVTPIATAAAQPSRRCPATC